MKNGREIIKNVSYQDTILILLPENKGEYSIIVFKTTIIRIRNCRPSVKLSGFSREQRRSIIPEKWNFYEIPSYLDSFIPLPK
jgi:hypothetical protein